MLPDKTTLQLFEAMQDQQITTAETAGMMTTVFNSAISGMVMVFGMLMFNKAIGGGSLSPVVKGVSGAKLSPLAPVANRKNIWITGSVAAGTATPGSDVDIIVELTEAQFGERDPVTARRAEDELLGLTSDAEVYFVRSGDWYEAWQLEKPERTGLIGAPSGLLRNARPIGDLFSIGSSGNPGNPDGITSDIISRAGLKEYEYRYFPPPEEETKPRVYAYTRRRTIGSYEVQLTRTDDSCSIKLYEYLPGWKKKLRATWTGIGEAECDRKFLEVVETVIQVRFEHKMALGR